MDYANLPPRAEPLAVSAAAHQRQGPDALSTRADTMRPVLAAAKTDATRTSAQGDFQPLDTFEVGDNDHVPVPPEPPRESTVLAVIASSVEGEVEPEVAVGDEEAPPPEPAPAREALTSNLREIEAGPSNPTVDIRS